MSTKTITFTLRGDGRTTTFSTPYTLVAVASVAMKDAEGNPLPAPGYHFNDEDVIFSVAPPVGSFLSVSATISAAATGGNSSVAGDLLTNQMGLFAFPPEDTSYVKTGYAQLASDTWTAGYTFPNGYTPFTCGVCMDSNGVPHCFGTDGASTRLLHFIGDNENKIWVEQTDTDPVPVSVWRLYGVPAIAPLPEGKIMLACAADVSGNPTQGTLLYDPTLPSGSRWATGPAFPFVTFAPKAYAFPDRQVVFVGGQISGASHAHVVTYTTDKGFTQVRDCPYAAEAMAIGSLPSGKAVLFGGVSRPSGTRLQNCYTMAQDGNGDFVYTPYSFTGVGRSDAVAIGTPDGVRFYGGYLASTSLPTNEVWDFHETAGQFTQATSAPSPIFSHGVQLPDASAMFVPEGAQSISNQAVTSQALRGAIRPYYYYKSKS